MTREQKKAEARELRVAGHKGTDIARWLEIPHSTLYEWIRDLSTRDGTVDLAPIVCYVCGKTFTPSHGNQKTCCGANARKRYHENQSRAACVDCGTALGGGTAYPSKTRIRCPECHYRHLDDLHRWRDEQITKWWNDGLKMKEIAARLNWTMNHLAVEMDRLRTRGYCLPYRYTTGKRAGTKFPELQRAA